MTTPRSTGPGARSAFDPSTSAAAATGAWLNAGPVLLAVDHGASNAAAARMAADLASRRGARVQAMTVFDTRPQLIPPPLDVAVALEERAGGDAVHAEQRAAVRDRLGATLGRPVDWPVAVRLGTPSPTIVDEAVHARASLIVLGLRRHGAIDRALHDETTLNVMRAAPCPVLGVAPDVKVPPRRVLVGVDFGRASLHAARVARDVMAGEGALVLAYAAPPEFPDMPDDGERIVHELGVEAAWRWFEGELGDVPGIAVTHVVLAHVAHRSVSDLLCDFADTSAIEMIAVGSRRHGRVERWVLGSVTSDLARDGAYSLLAVPPDASAAG